MTPKLALFNKFIPLSSSLAKQKKMNLFNFTKKTLIPFPKTPIKLKLVLLLLVTIIPFQYSSAQCTNGTAYGTMTAPTAGGSVSNGCTYAGEYNTVNTVAAATIYTSTSSIVTDFITVHQGTPGGAVIASGLTPLNWTSTVAGTYYIHINTNSGCGTQSSCRTITLTHVGSGSPMAYSSSSVTQSNTADVENCATDAQLIGIEIVTTGGNNPIDLTQLRVRTNGCTAPLTDIANIDIYYTGTSSTFSTANLFGSAAPAATGTNININGTQTLETGTNYFWVAYDVVYGTTAGNLLDASCTRLTVDGANHVPAPTAPAGSRPLITCTRQCPTSATVFSDDFETGTTVEGVIPGTTYGSSWTGLPHTGTRHMWLNIQNGLSNLDVYERRFDGYYMGCDVTFDYWYLHNSTGFDAEYTLLDDNNNVIDFNHVITPGADVNVYQNHSVTFTPTTTGVTLRIHCNSTGGAGQDIAFDDLSITQCCAPIPILLSNKLLSFDAECESDKIILDWTTTSEISNDYFTVERSSDAINFEPLAQVDDNSSSASTNYYEYIDQNPIYGEAYYRLKQTKFDGTISYSEILEKSCERLGQQGIDVFPNPFKKAFVLNLWSDVTNPIHISVLDCTGKMVYQQTFENNREQLELTFGDQLTSGVYILKVDIEGTRYLRKLIKN